MGAMEPRYEERNSDSMDHDELAKIAMENRSIAMDNKEGVAVLAQKVESQADQMKAAFKRIDENQALVQTVQKIVTQIEIVLLRQDSSDKRQAEFTSNISKRMDKLEEDFSRECNRVKETVDEIRMKPARKWDGAVSFIVTTAIGGIIGFLIKHFAG